MAQHFLREIPRTKGLKPEFKRGETSVTLLSFVNGQSTAAAQGTAVALGTYHTIALLTRDGDQLERASKSGLEYAMYGMGRGFHGQLGNGEYEDSQVPKRVGMVERDRPVQLYKGSSDDIHLAVVTAGSSHSASISRRGELYTWGLASSGELGHGGWTPIEVAVPRMILTLNRTRIVSVCAGANHTLAISESGQLWSCGRGRHGQLGHGHFHDEGVLTLVESIQHERIVSAAAGKAHSVALAADGKMFTWGDARHGQLGHPQLAALMQGPNPQPIAIPFPQPIQSLEPGKLRPPARVTAIAAGGNHTMAVTVGGSLLAFGSNSYGQLGLGDTIDRMLPTEVIMAIDPSEICVPLRAMQVQCGAAHSLVLLQHRGRMEVRATGNNSYGQLGLGNRENQDRFFPIASLCKPVTKQTNTLTAHMTRHVVEEGVQRRPRVACILAGDWHSGAVTYDGDLYLWGRGDCGQLGHGDDRNRWVPTRMEGYKVVHPDRTLRRNRKPSLKVLILPANASGTATNHPMSSRTCGMYRSRDGK